MKKHTTKRALLMSALSLLVCVSMLVGSTFAWFTDSVSSDRNIIQAGNLDVTLEYWDGDSYEEVTSSTKLFNDAALWEPGHTEVAYLRIDNAGSLALKYQLAVNVYNETSATNVAGETFKLSDHLVFSVVDKKLTSRDDMFTRDEAIAEAGNAMGLTSYSRTVEMLPADEPDCVALIIYMPTSVGNEANYRGAAPTITLGTTLVAAQMASEQDSWNNSFDKDATYPLLSSVVIEQTTTAPTVITAGDVDVSVPAGAEPGTYAIKLDNYSETTDANGQTSIGLDISLLKDGVAVAAQPGVKYPVSIEIGKNLEVTALTHKGVAVAHYSYDPITGILSFETDSFSPFAVTYKEADADSVFVPSDPEAAEKLENDSVVAVDENGNTYATFKAAIESGASKLYIKKGADLGTVTHFDVARDLVIYGNGAKISGGEGDLSIDQYTKLTKDITVTVYNLHGIAYWGTRYTSYTLNMNMYNCENVRRIYMNGTTGINNINMVNCTADKATLVGDTAIYSNANGTINVDGCTFTNIGCPINLNHKVDGEQTVNVTNCTFVDCSTEGTAAYYAPIRLYNSTAGANQTLTVSGNAFTYSEGKAPINNADVLLNAKHNGVDAAGTIKANVQAGATVADGANVDFVYTVSSAADLKDVADIVNAAAAQAPNAYDNRVVKLLNDIDLGGMEWIPIGDYAFSRTGFRGTFDGQGYTISNFKITQITNRPSKVAESPYGLFGNLYGTIKNLTVSDVNIDVAGKFIGTLVGRMHSGSIENCHVVNANVTCKSWTVGGMVGQYNNGTISGCSVKDSTITAYGGMGGVVGVALNSGERTIENCTATNCTLVQNGSFGGNYDKMFGGIIGALYGDDLTVRINGCTVADTTILGEASDKICGYVGESNTLISGGYATQVDADGNETIYRLVSTTEELMEGLMNGESVMLDNNIDLNGPIVIPGN